MQPIYAVNTSQALVRANSGVCGKLYVCGRGLWSRKGACVGGESKEEYTCQIEA